MAERVYQAYQAKHLTKISGVNTYKVMGIACLATLVGSQLLTERVSRV